MWWRAGMLWEGVAEGMDLWPAATGIRYYKYEDAVTTA